MQQRTAVLVLSFDGNRDMWLPFFRFFSRYWSDCPFKVYLTVNQLDFSYPGVHVLKTGNASDWSSELFNALSQIQEDYLIVMLEDYFIYKPVYNASIFQALDVMRDQRAGFLKLGTFPSKYKSLWPGKAIPEHPGYHTIEPDAKYLVNLQTAIWDKSILQQLIRPGESPWQFEINGSRRYQKLGISALAMDPKPGVNVTHGPITYLCGALTRGVLMRSAIRLAKKEAIALDTSHRKTESLFTELNRRFYISLPLPMRKIYMAIRSRLNKVNKSKGSII
jgi:hypothetical protein